MKPLVAGALALSALLVALAAEAQPVELPETEEASRDPLGSGGLHDLPSLLEAETRAVDARVRAEAEAALVAAPASGAVLTAAAQVRESEHDVAVRFATPVAEVRHRIVLRNPSRYRAEVRYVLPIPPDAALTELSVRAGGVIASGEPTAPEREGYDALAIGASLPQHGAETASVEAPAMAPMARARKLVSGTRASMVPSGAANADATAKILLDVAPIEPDGELEVVVAYAVGVRERGGVARLTLPPRGADLRTVEARVTVEAVGLGAPRLWGREARARGEALPGWASLALEADVRAEPAVQGALYRVRCGGRPCSVLRVAAARTAPVDERVVVLLDASPSTVGPARGRLGPAIAALLAEASPASTVQVLAFASRARELVPEALPPSAVPFAPITEALGETLGSATRFEAAWPAARAWAHDASARGETPHLVIVGDGGLTDGSSARRAFDEARRAGVRVSVLNVADRATRRALAEYARGTGGQIIEAGAAAKLAERGRSTGPLRQALRALFAPEISVAGARERLRTGEARVSVARRSLHAPRGIAVVSASAPEAAAVGRWAAAQLGLDEAIWTAGLPRSRMAPDALGASRCGEPFASPTAPPRAGPPLSLAFARECAPTPPPPPRDPLAGRGVPPEVLLDNLRSRIIPAARGCLRDDRRGRLDYAVRAVFRFRLEDREITRAEVEGEIDDALRACLLTTIDALDVPRFEGAIVVTYPIYTERAEVPPAIEIAPDVEERLRVLFGESDADSQPAD